MTQFTKGLDPKDAMKIGINYQGLRKQLNEFLRILYNDYLKYNTIYGLSRYNTEVPRTYIRKIADLEIIKRITVSKKNMQYIWNGGDNPDFVLLANRVINESVPRPEKSEFKRNYNKESSEITVLLMENGMDSAKIPVIIGEIIRIMS